MPLQGTTTVFPLSINSSQESILTHASYWFLLPFILAFVFIFFVFYRRQREQIIQREQAELKLKALQAQINPHFIFNCLNSIHYCIKNKQSETAADYLLKFSYLVRRVLENSPLQAIPLQEDLEILKAYLDLEQLRSENQFTYAIKMDENIDLENTAVPMLIVQPFVENSIWHGLPARANGGHIQLHYQLIHDQLCITAEDNGKGPPTSQQHPAKRYSLGKKLIEEQLKAIESLTGKSTSFNEADKQDDKGEILGRTIHIQLPHHSIY